MSSPTKQDILRVGAIGVGARGLRLAEHLDTHSDSAVVAVTDVSPESRHRAADALALDSDALFSNHSEMLDTASLDAVVISSPHTFHYEQLIEAFEHGLHVLCEKPLTTDRREARDIVRRDESRDETLMLGYQRHFHPAFCAARAYLTEHDVCVRNVTAEISQPWISEFRDTWRANPTLSGGGHLYDVGSHVIDAVLMMTGLTPTSVIAEMVFDDDDQLVDTESSIGLRFDNGAIGTVSVTGDAPAVREHAHLWGDHAVTIQGSGWVDRRVTGIAPDGTETVIHSSEDGKSNLLDVKADAFVRAVNAKSVSYATARDGMYTTFIIEAAYESARTGKRVELSFE